MLHTLRQELRQPPTLFQTTPTVIIDAGLATAANLAVSQAAGFHYVAVSRNRPQEIPQEGLVVANTMTKSPVAWDVCRSVIPRWPDSMTSSYNTKRVK